MTLMLDKLKMADKTGLLIGGEWRSGSGSMAVLDPATETELAEVATASKADAVAAVDAAEDAAEEWAATAPRERAEILRRSFELMRENEEALAELVVMEHGKSYSDALGEVRYGAEFYRWFSEEAPRIAGEVRTAPGGDKKILTLVQPVGICLLITPWNFPVAMATRKIGPALAAGCTTILKPASDTPLSALAVAHLMEEAGLPPGVVNVISARGSSGVTDAILEDTRLRKLSFTGSTEVGRMLLEKASGQVLRTSMELGGNAPFVVFEDADLEAALEGAMVAKMRNAGEACTAANRFLVHAAVVDEFSTRLSERMGALKVGPGMDRDNEVGPMINARSRDDIAALVTETLDGGARALTGGDAPDRPGYFYTPTVLTEVTADAAILGKEIFGPVAPIVTFESEDDAVRIANDTEFGLMAYVYTEDISRGLRVCERIDSGMIGLNKGLVSDPAAPFGGLKQSGLGKEGSREGIMEYLDTKYVGLEW